MELRAAFHKAVASGQSITQGNIAIGTNGGRQTLNLIVQPLRGSRAADSVYLIVFRDVGGINLEPASGQPDTVPDAQDVTRHLEAELQIARERLQTTSEELESSNEELDIRQRGAFIDQRGIAIFE